MFGWLVGVEPLGSQCGPLKGDITRFQALLPDGVMNNAITESFLQATVDTFLNLKLISQLEFAMQCYQILFIESGETRDLTSFTPPRREGLAVGSWSILLIHVIRCVYGVVSMYGVWCCVQSWALAIFINFLNDKNYIFCIFYLLIWLGVDFLNRNGAVIGYRIIVYKK